ncbi:MAG: hypothetical protein JNK72_07625 [Myxococcales bacterium]|nr:hypothetical protein [Myxococcales bacterium]
MRRRAVGLLAAGVLSVARVASADPNPLPDSAQPATRRTVRANVNVNTGAPPPVTDNYGAPPPVSGTGQEFNAPPPVSGTGQEFNAPPPVTGSVRTGRSYVQPPIGVSQPVYPMVRVPPAPTESELMRPGLFVMGGAGAAVPMGSALSDTYGSGFSVLGEAGVMLRGGLALRAEVGLRALSPTDASAEPLSVLSYGIGVRYHLVRTGSFHPFVDLTVDAFSPLVSTTSGSTTRASGAGTGVSASAGLGALLELSGNFGLLVGLRYDLTLSEANTELEVGDVLLCHGGLLWHF